MYEDLIQVQGARLVLEVMPLHDLELPAELAVAGDVGRVVQIDADHWARGEVHEYYRIGDFLVFGLSEGVVLAGALPAKGKPGGEQTPGRGQLCVVDASEVFCKLTARLVKPELYETMPTTGPQGEPATP